METNWLIIIIAVIAVIALIIYLFIQNQRDKKAYLQRLIDEDNNALPKEPDNEIDSTDE
jgi:low affinity Fe/Cu permease